MKSTSTSILSSLVFTFVALFLSFAAAAPVGVSDAAVARDVFVPPVLSPNANSVWKVGTNQAVTWDVSRPPKAITNKKAMVVLVKDGRLNLKEPLATDIDVLIGFANIVVPDVEPGSNYQVLVFGDSGNTGEVFTIIS